MIPTKTKLAKAIHANRMAYEGATGPIGTALVVTGSRGWMLLSYNVRKGVICSMLGDIAPQTLHFRTGARIVLWASAVSVGVGCSAVSEAGHVLAGLANLDNERKLDRYAMGSCWVEVPR